MNAINLIPDILAILTFATFIIIGVKKGFVHTLIQSSSFLVTIIVCLFLSAPMTEMIKESSLGILFNEVIHDFILGVVRDAPGMLLKDMSLPEFFIKGISESQPVIEIADVLTQNITNTVINVLVFVLLFVLTKIALKILDKTLDLFTKIPIIKQCNSLLGGVAGAITGALWIYVALAVIAAFVFIPSVYSLSEIILNSYLASYLYENNIILSLF